MKVAWAGPDRDRLDAEGLETLILDEPSLIVDAYINEVNRQGGIGENCFELVKLTWDLLSPDASLQQICMSLPEHDPLLLATLFLNNATLRCATTAAQIPTLAILTSVPQSSVMVAEGRLFLDHGSVEYLMSASIEIAEATGFLTAGDRVGLLVSDGASAESEAEAAETVSQRLGLDVAAVVAVPSEFGTIGVTVAERRVHLMETGISEAELEEAVSDFGDLRPEQVTVLRRLEQFFIDTASELQSSGVTAVVVSAGATDARRLMRAAELTDWTPRWITNDSQPAVLTLTNAPARQAQNLVQVSSRRAAGDPLTELDRGCVSLRNTSADAPLFSGRVHTDAWGLMTATCEYLDILFGAMTRVDGPLTRESVLAALNMTDYETAQGSLIRFAPEDHNGSDRFRVLKADPSCVLDDWGCMRAVTDWFAPAADQ